MSRETMPITSLPRKRTWKNSRCSAKACWKRQRNPWRDATIVRKKAIREIVAKRLGSSGGALEQYQDIFLNIARHVIPRYERTRVVQLIPFANDEWVLVCSCPFWEKHGWACRHMYKVLGRKPTVCDAHVRWHIGYGHRYGRKNDATSKNT